MNTGTVAKRSLESQALYDGLEGLPSSHRFSRDQLEVIYGLGYAHIVQGQYAQALPIMAFLAQYGPTQRHYLYGLALCLQMQQRFDEAIALYSFCALLYPQSFEAMQRIAQCQVSVLRYDEACETLQTLLLDARESGNVDLERKAQGMLDHIGKHVVERP